QILVRGKDSRMPPSILETLSDFLRANIFIAAESSLSNAVGLARAGPVIHPAYSGRAKLIQVPNWYMIDVLRPWTDIKDRQKQPMLFRCVSNPENISQESFCTDWQPIDAIFWKDLLQSRNYINGAN
ncbi:hypothetical protein, partial [Flagellimonas marinaquae]